MKIAIVGGRTFDNYEKLKTVLNPYKSYCTQEICGMANGADKLGKKWAEDNFINVKCYPADWDKFGKGAGHIRNKQMAIDADFVVAFWDCKSRGTKNMIDTTMELKKSILVVFYDK